MKKTEANIYLLCASIFVSVIEVLLRGAKWHDIAFWVCFAVQACILFGFLYVRFIKTDKQ